MDKVYSIMFTHIFEPILCRFDVPESKRCYVIKFYLTGVFAIVMEWLNNDCADDMNNVVEIITSCVLRGNNYNE